MLFHSLVGENTKILVVGDQFQALYGFTGVDVERSLSIIPAATFESLGGGRKVKTMSITQCRRCPVGVVDMAKALVGADNIAKHPDKGAGEIQVVPFDLKYAPGILKDISSLVTWSSAPAMLSRFRSLLPPTATASHLGRNPHTGVVLWVPARRRRPSSPLWGRVIS